MEKEACPECYLMVTPLKGGGLRAHGPVHARCAQDPANRIGTRECEGCDRVFVLGDGDAIPEHGPVPGMVCTQQPGDVSDPAPTVEPVDDTPPPYLYGDHPLPSGTTPDNHSQADPQKGPWFGAMYDGECSVNGCGIFEGDRIRADGQGGYECEDCGDPDLWDTPETQAWDNPSQPAPANAVLGPAHPYAAVPDPPVREVTELHLPTPDEFTDPSTPEDVPDELNVSGQPRARYEWRGSVNMGYLTTDPETGEFRRYKNGKPKGWTRATTFNKAASDSKAINDWGKRNIVIGASRRRDVLLRAHGLTHENDRAVLEGIVAELEEAAGAKVGSDLGTYLHSFTELMDAGLKEPSDAPEEFRLSLARYEKVLADAGLEPVPGLIERTTGIREFGGVRGTFDRIFYHRPSGTYMVGDLKTGKTMEYAMDETNTQMWIYAHGVNQNGVYDWNTDTWDLPWEISTADGASSCKVREDVGVIVHMPVQGPQAGTVTLVHADLQAGAKHAELCHAIRSRAKSKVRAFAPPESVRAAVELENETTEDIWRALFRGATTSEDATVLWKRAKEEGVQGIFLNELIELAREAIRQHS